jgi:hypothetical protein
MTTPKGAPELTSAQAIPETTVNEQVRHTEAGACHFVVADNDLTGPPGSCADGASYIIAATATGLWAGKENYIATALGANATGGWTYHAPIEGMTAYIQDENDRHLYGGATWASDTTGGSYTDEQVRDVIGTALVAGANVTITPNDGADTITIAATAGGGGTDMFATGQTFRAAYGRVNSTATYDLGIALTATGSNSLITQGNTSFLTTLPRSRRGTGTTAEAYAGWRDADLVYYRRNGFKASFMIGVSQIAGTDTRVMVGLVGDSLLNTDENPVDFDRILAFALDAADSNWNAMHCNSTTGATKTDSGITLTAGDVIEVVIECDPGGSTVDMTLHQWTGTSATIAATYGPLTVSTNLPSDTAALTPYVWINNNGTAASSDIDLVHIKILG